MMRVVLVFVFMSLGIAAATECNKLNEEKRRVPDCPPQKTCANKDIKVSCLENATETFKYLCVCKEGYFRNSDGECVTEDDCSKCNKLNEEIRRVPDCPPPKTCANKDIKVKCLQNATETFKYLCVCKEGYFRNSGGECVTEDDCTKCGGQNEYYSNRARSDVTCASLDSSGTDEDQAALSDDGQCLCLPGTARDENNVCVPYDQCNKPCGPEETKDYCPTDCPSDYCPRSQKKVSCPRPEICPPPKCKCRFNTRRAKNGTCIPTRDCPPFKCSKPNEEYNPCPPLCPNGFCSQATPTGRCPAIIGHIGIILECTPACRCKSGYFWNEDKICVPYKQCPGKGNTAADTE